VEDVKDVLDMLHVESWVAMQPAEAVVVVVVEEVMMADCK